MKSLMIAAVTSLAFVHFKNPADSSPLYVLNEDAQGQPGVTAGDDGFARDANGDKLPIGVRVFGPGSQVYRAAEDKIANDAIKAGRKALTGTSLRENATYKLARCTSEFVNFTYALKDGGAELTVTPASDLDERVRVASAFFDDVRFVAFRDQVEKEQHDLGNFTPTASNS